MSDFEGGDLAAVEQETSHTQLSDAFPSVPVNVDGPVQVQMVPTITGAPRTWVVGDTADKVLNEDPRRASATFLSVDEPFFFGFTQAQANASTAAQWPELVPLVIRTRTEVWIRSATGGTPASITTVPENWAA